MRTCSYCHLEKSYDEFHKNARACKQCKREYNTRNSNHIKEVRRLDHLKNKDRDNLNNKRHYQDNKEKYAANYQRDKEKIHQYYLDSYYSDKNILKWQITQCKKRAVKNDLEFDLDTSFLEALLEKQNSCCALTGLTFNNQKSDEYRSRPFTISVDRINCNKGYTRDNVRLVCAVVNFALNEFGQEIFDRMCEAYISKKREI